MNAIEILQMVLPDLVPMILALAITNLIILVSHCFDSFKRPIFQSICFTIFLSAGISYLVTSSSTELMEFWKSFRLLSVEIRLCLSCVMIGTVYFVAGMYFVSPDNEMANETSARLFETPASCDQIVQFQVPVNLPEDRVNLFKLMFEKICKEMLEDAATLYEMPNEAVDWIDRMLQYTVSGGKLNRGLTVMQVHETLVKSFEKKMSDKERCQSAILGWCVEFLQAFFLVADDVMDSSITRRGQPCWYLVEDVQLIAINDSFILESCVFKILKRYFGSEEYYYQLVDIFIEVTRQTEFGQLLDLTSQPLEGPLDLSRFTIERYNKVVKYKTAFYSFYLPVALGMIVTGIKSASLYQKAKDILLIMGEYFQVQDDYLDCFGHPDVIGKIGTDIEDKKCSWLVVQALHLASAKQRQIIQDNYGVKDAKKVMKIKKLYGDLKLEQVFETYEEESYNRIIKLLDEEKNLPREVFMGLLSKIYKRSK